MIKSLIVSHRKRWNGETEYAAGIVRAEAELGFKVTVVTPPDCIFAHNASRYARIINFPGKLSPGSPLSLGPDIVFLKKLIKKEKFNLVHSLRETSHLMTAGATPPDIPLIHLRSGTKMPSSSWLSRFLYQKKTAAVIVSSQTVRRNLIEKTGIDPGAIHKILAPVDCDKFKPIVPDPTLRKELNIAEQAPVILCVARLAPIKGHPYLVEALAMVKKSFPDTVLVLVGRPWEGQPDNLFHQAKQLGIEQGLICPGPKKDIPRFLSIASVCTLASTGSEENSRAIEEYMAAGKPVVATKVGVIPELVQDQKTGFLVPPAQPRALGQALLSVLSNQVQAHKMGQTGRKIAETQLSTRVFAKSLKKTLTQISLLQ